MVHRRAVVIGPFLVLLTSAALGAAAHAASVSVSPPSVSSDYLGMITLNISGLTSGQSVLVEKFLDLNGNGSIDSDEPLMQSFGVADGQVFSIGGVRDSNVPGDEDGMADGQIRTTLSFQRQSEFNRGIGSFVYRVSPVTGGFTPVTAPFSVTQSADAQRVTGQVNSGAAPVPGAFVALLRFGEGNNFVAGVTAEANGMFTLNAATGTYQLVATKGGFLFDLTASPNVTLTTGAAVTQNLSLTVADRTIAGQLTDMTSGAGIAGVQLFSQSDTGLVSLILTDSGGNFTIPSSSAAEQWRIEASELDPAFLGYVGLSPIVTGGGNVSGVSIQWRKATALIYGRLTDGQGNALSEISVDARTTESEHRGVGFTDTEGNYVIGVVAGMWSAQPRQLPGYLVQGADVTVANGQAVRTDLVARACNAHLRGRITDEVGAAVGNILVITCPQNPGAGSCLATNSTSDGNFDVCVVGGVWSVFAESSSLAERMLVGAVVSLTVPDGGEQNDIMIAVRHAHSLISGSVRDHDTGSPLDGVEVQASASINGTEYRSQVETDPEGNYSLPVSDGTWQVRPDCGRLIGRGYSCPPNQGVTIPPNAVVNFQPSTTCTGDCDRMNGVTVSEFLTLMNIALGNADTSACPQGIPADASVTISLLIQAVNNALEGCGVGLTLSGI